MDQITEEDFGMPKNVFNDVFILSEKQEQLMEILWKSDKSAHEHGYHADSE